MCFDQRPAKLFSNAWRFGQSWWWVALRPNEARLMLLVQSATSKSNFQLKVGALIPSSRSLSSVSLPINHIYLTSYLFIFFGIDAWNKEWDQIYLNRSNASNDSPNWSFDCLKQQRTKMKLALHKRLWGFWGVLKWCLQCQGVVVAINDRQRLSEAAKRFRDRAGGSNTCW